MAVARRICRVSEPDSGLAARHAACSRLKEQVVMAATYEGIAFSSVWGTSPDTPLARAAWLVKEQVAVAAMDCNAGRFAYQLVENIRKQFPSSKRADRLTVRLPGGSGLRA